MRIDGIENPGNPRKNKHLIWIATGRCREERREMPIAQSLLLQPLGNDLGYRTALCCVIVVGGRGHGELFFCSTTHVHVCKAEYSKPITQEH